MPPIRQDLRSGLSRGNSKPPTYAPSAENFWTRALFRSVTKTSSFLLMAMPIGEENSPGLSPFLPQARTNLGPSGESARRLPGAMRSSIATSPANIPCSEAHGHGFEARGRGSFIEEPPSSLRDIRPHRSVVMPRGTTNPRDWGPSLLRPLAVRLRLLDQPLHGGVDGPFTGIAEPLGADHAPVIDDVVHRRAGVIPLLEDRFVDDERPPVQLLAVHHPLELLCLGVISVHADQGERLLFERLHERPLVGPVGPSDQSVLGPEVEQHDLATEVAQLEAPAVLVLAVDLLGRIADGQVADLVQLRSCRLSNGILVGDLHVAEVG